MVALCLPSAYESGLYAQSDDKPILLTNASDATIRASAAPSADRIWMVGDRGLILATENGGRTWIEQESNTTVDLKGVAFENEKVGWAVGGTVLPYSHRSAGTLLATRDGGLNWRSIGIPELAVLRGIQSFGGGHLVAWGDWSPAFQTGLIESHDSGSTWTPRPTPTTHLQSCAWFDSQRGIAIDRLSRVYYLSGNAPPELLSIGGDPTRPLLEAKINEMGWWVTGECGQVYWSENGRKWLDRILPGSTRDHRHIRVQAIALKDEHVWLVGVPGHVVWHSSNRGKDWDVQSLSTTLPLHCICVPRQDCVVAGGMLCNIQGTRNNGQGWWSIHSAGAHVALLNIASTQEQIAWDALAYTANETRHQAAAFVIHDQRLHERADAFCDSHHRITGLGPNLGLAMLEISNAFPIGDLPQGRRSHDLAAYASDANAPSLVASMLVLWLRMMRPDTIVCDEKSHEDPIVNASLEAVKLARKLASESSYQCFSEASGIPELTWNSKRIVARSNSASSLAPSSSLKRRSEVHFAPTTVLKSTGKLLSDVLTPITPSIASYLDSGSDGFMAIEAQKYSGYNTIYGHATKTGKDLLLVDSYDSTGTKRPLLRSRSANLQTMLATSQQSSLIARMLEMKGPDLADDVRWHASLKSFLRATPADHRMDALWQLAQGYRHEGYWNRWRVCLDLLIAEDPRSGAAELACLQQLQFANSDEVTLFRSRAASSPTQDDSRKPSLAQSATMSSPFTQEVQLASHSSQASTKIVSPSEEFERIRATVPLRFPTLQWDPRFLAAEGAFERKRLKMQPSNAAMQMSPFQKLANSNGLVGWRAIGFQELSMNHRKAKEVHQGWKAIGDSISPLYQVRSVGGRPKLDGQSTDPIWQSSQAMTLKSAWMEDPSSTCDVRMVHDSEFLFIAVDSRRGASSAAQPNQSERLTFRIDTDRDYLTWFEIQVDESGRTSERCTDMEGWAPEWYFKTVTTDEAWNFEAAIPIAQLQAETCASNDVWALSIHRSIPNHDVQTNRATYSDRLLLTSPMMIRFDGDDNPP
jgi:photosystem II stability/assembly factor-like uncharacterized protein